MFYLFFYFHFPHFLYVYFILFYLYISASLLFRSVHVLNGETMTSAIPGCARDREIETSPLFFFSSSFSFSLPCLKYITASAPDAPADGSRVQRPPRHETGTSSALLRCRLHSRIHGDPVFQLRRCSYNRIVSEGRIFISIFILRLLLLTQ